MKTTTISLALVAALIGTGGIAAQTIAPTDAKNELSGILKRLHQKPTDESYVNNPGWLDANVQAELKQFAKANAGTEQALTAEVWLAVSEIESAQSERAASRVKKTAAQCITLNGIAKRTPNSWHAKVARLGRAGALLTGGDYEGLQSQVGEIMASVGNYQGEADEQFQAYLKAMHVEAKDLEPNLRRMLVISACNSNKLDDALKHARELQAKFPDWAKWQHLDDIINQLEKGQSPYRPRK